MTALINKIIKGLDWFQKKLLWQAIKIDRRTITRILASTNSPSTSNSESLFQELQSKYSRIDYSYEPFPSWKRSMQHVIKIISLRKEFENKDIKLLDVCCGDGGLGYAFSQYGYDVTLFDMDDWRNDLAKKLPFVQGKLEDPINLKKESFDFIISFNAFEHITDPEKSFHNLLSLCKKGGYIYLNFGPLYASSWGLHAYSSLYMPYPQYLFSHDFIMKKIHELNINDLNLISKELQPLNKCKASKFKDLWHDNKNLVNILYEDNYENKDNLNIIKEYPKSFTGRNLTYDDVVTDIIVVLLQKK